MELEDNRLQQRQERHRRAKRPRHSYRRTIFTIEKINDQWLRKKEKESRSAHRCKHDHQKGCVRQPFVIRRHRAMGPYDFSEG